MRIDGAHDAPPVLLLHSLGSALDIWDPQVAAWRERFRLIRYDARGHGRSPAPPGEYTLDDLGNDAVRVLDAAGVATAHICGISLGGLTGMWLGVYHPSRVRRLIVAGSAPRVGTRQRWIERIARARAEGMAAMAELAMTTWFTAEFKERQRSTVAAIHRLVASTTLEGYVGCCAALRDADLRQEIHRIQARTLVITGEHDPTVTAADVEAMRATIARARVQTLPGAHLANVECASEFSRAAGAFLTGAAGRGFSRRPGLRS